MNASVMPICFFHKTVLFNEPHLYLESPSVVYWLVFLVSDNDGLSCSKNSDYLVHVELERLRVEKEKRPNQQK